MEQLHCILFVVFGLAAMVHGGDFPYGADFEYEYRVLESILKLNAKHNKSDETISTLSTKLEAALHTIDELSSSVQTLQNQGYSTGSTFVRWGRTTCPDGDSVKVYDGWVGGSHYTHAGGGANLQCMPKDPIFGTSNDATQSIAFIYGTEYELGGQFQNHEVPCAVCWIPRSSNIMLPARSECYPGWKVEYHGYLASEHYTHPRLEYVCLDEDLETTEKSATTNSNGALLYYVEARCGSLPCDTYPSGKDLTCAVCSYSPQTSSVKPYV